MENYDQMDWDENVTKKIAELPPEKFRSFFEEAAKIALAPQPPETKE